MTHWYWISHCSIINVTIITTVHHIPNRHRQTPRAWVCPRFLPKREFFLATVALLALEGITVIVVIVGAL